MRYYTVFNYVIPCWFLHRVPASLSAQNGLCSLNEQLLVILFSLHCSVCALLPYLPDSIPAPFQRQNYSFPLELLSISLLLYLGS